MLGYLVALWGFVGVSLLLGTAVLRLAPMAFELVSIELTLVQWLALAGSLLFMGFAEGYRGFQQNFSPRVAARIRYLSQHPTVLRALLAPLFCMGFFGTTRRRQIVSFVLTAGIVLLVLLVQAVPQPWRGIIDAGVVLGLSWGLMSLVFFTLQAFFAADFRHSPELPDRA